MKKRGNLILAAIISLLLAAIAITLPFVAEAQNTGKISFKIASVKNIALILNSVCSYDFELEINYEINLNNYILEISESSVKIYDKSFVSLNNDIIQGRDPNFAAYYYTCDKDIDSKLDGPKIVTFKKTKEKIIITSKNENIQKQ